MTVYKLVANSYKVNAINERLPVSEYRKTAYLNLGF